MGFIYGLIFFILATNYLGRPSEMCSDCLQRFGFPFHYLETSDLGKSAGILWTGLIANILIALIFSFVIGLICKTLIETLFNKKV
jgi:hypothetical protein